MGTQKIRLPFPSKNGSLSQRSPRSKILEHIAIILSAIFLSGCSASVEKTIPDLSGTYSSDGGKSLITIELLGGDTYAVTLADGKIGACELRGGILKGDIDGEKITIEVRESTAFVNGETDPYEKVSGSIQPVPGKMAENVETEKEASSSPTETAAEETVQSYSIFPLEPSRPLRRDDLIEEKPPEIPLAKNEPVEAATPATPETSSTAEDGPIESDAHWEKVRKLVSNRRYPSAVKILDQAMEKAEDEKLRTEIRADKEALLAVMSIFEFAERGIERLEPGSKIPLKGIGGYSFDRYDPINKIILAKVGVNEKEIPLIDLHASEIVEFAKPETKGDEAEFALALFHAVDNSGHRDWARQKLDELSKSGRDVRRWLDRLELAALSEGTKPTKQNKGTSEQNDIPIPPPGKHALVFNRKGVVEVPKFHYQGGFPITLELIVVPEHNYDNQFLVGDRYKGGWDLGIQNGYWYFSSWHKKGDIRILSDEPVKMNERVHLAAILDDEITLFVTGKRQKQRIGFPHPYKPSPTFLRIGRHPNGKYGFSGRIEWVRISKFRRYPRNFDPTQLKLGKERNTLLLFDFSEGQGQVCRDSSGNDFHGVLKNVSWAETNE